MLLAPAPSLAFVIGLPVGLMAVVGLFGGVTWMLLGRIDRS